MEHDEVEKLVNEVHVEESKKLEKEFRIWFNNISKKYIGVILPELVIAEECINITNTRKRSDTAKIVFEREK